MAASLTPGVAEEGQAPDPLLAELFGWAAFDNSY